MENTNELKEITRRFIIAVDYLKETGLLKSYKELIKANIRAQRISDFKKYVKENTKNSYVSPVELKQLHDYYGVSYNYIMDGIMPICSEKSMSFEPSVDHQLLNSDHGLLTKLNDLPHEILVLAKRVETLELEIRHLKNKHKS
ncbi:hypothetical protein [uncultured Algoriphagus sp.]|uniref:hypothetical protein n=1 Tax=uncultured Algoriphagus sp. TaxID=417365 RepID=UPI0030EED485|tara:strand:+ start:1862 stop:2290 length:429 start_codon:yes stop_codon:yes gene_type:complete